MKSDIYSFVFRTLPTEEALDKTERLSRLAWTSTVDGDVAQRLPLDVLDSDLVARAKPPVSG